MKKLYTTFAVTFLLNLFAGLHWSFANENLPKETLPTSRPKPVLKAPFKTLPFKALLPNVELYEFNPKAYTFDKIVGLKPIWVGKDWQTVTNDPVKFTLTPSKSTAMLGEEIELTLTAELLDISPRLLFTLEELRNYTIKVILPQDFIQTGGTYLNFATGTLTPATPKHTYTIKGRYLDKPALDDCFKVLRKLNDEIFVLKNTTCINLIDIDSSNSSVEQVNYSTREVLTGIDTSKININSFAARGLYEIASFGSKNETFYYNCKSDGSLPVLNIQSTNYGEITSKQGSVKIKVTFLNSDNTTQIHESSNGFVGYPFPNLSIKVTIQLEIYSGLNNSGTLLNTKSQEIIVNRGPCPLDNTLKISTNETSLCPGASTILTATTNCTAANISWQKDGAAYGLNGATTSVNSSGTYKAVCNNPAMVSNTITVNVSNTPTAPNIKTNKNSITPGEFATLTAINCQGTVVWKGPNNFEDTGDEISVGKPGNYQALCRSNCNGNVNESTLSAIVSISLLPLRLEADKYEKYANETALISAYGCNNGYISWKVNGQLLPQSDNPLTAYSAGTYAAQCRSFNGAESDWVTLYISEKTSNTPFVRASRTNAFPTDNVTLTASGCPSGWYYKWEIPVTASDNSVTIQRPVGTPQTVSGPGNYKVQCILNDLNQSAYTSVTVNPLNIGDVIINIEANKTEANDGEPVIFTVSGSCPNGGGIRWMINGMNYWSYVGETFTGIGPGTYAARCESGPQISPTVYYTVKRPKLGGISIVSDKTRAKDNELVTLSAIGCTNEVNWTLPNGTEVAGSTIIYNFGPGTYKAKCVNKFGFTSDPASITIDRKNDNEPEVIPSVTSVAINQVGELVIKGCLNDWVQWGIPRKDANGNTYYNYVDRPTLVIQGPGVYRVRCSGTDPVNVFQTITVQPAPADALIIKSSLTAAKPTEAVTLTAYGCPNGTVKWEFGTQTATGTQIIVIGPGLRKAKCVGDYTNNGDWAMVNIRSDGNITPYFTTSVTSACPTQPVTITATGCPNGWWYQTQWIKPDKLQYWLDNRNALIWDVFNFGPSTITLAGPNRYSARCISPDGSWMGDFNDKTITVEPAFPADLRATNNGPALTGATSVKLAVTEVPGASYVWSGPSFSSFSRVADIPNPTEAKSGIYTITLSVGGNQPWACNSTATTKVAISGCDIRIKASDAITGEESYVLSRAISGTKTFNDLALSVERVDGSSLQNVSYSWSGSANFSATSSFAIINNSGNYSVKVTPIGGTTSCVANTIIFEENPIKQIWGQARSGTFKDGTIVKIVPIKYGVGNVKMSLRNGENIETIDPANFPLLSKLLLYTKGATQWKDLLHVIPTNSYIQNHTEINPSDFTGYTLIFDEQNKSFKAGWKYLNGQAIGRLLLNNSTTGSCDARIFVEQEVEGKCTSSGWAGGGYNDGSATTNQGGNGNIFTTTKKCSVLTTTNIGTLHYDNCCFSSFAGSCGTPGPGNLDPNHPWNQDPKTDGSDTPFTNEIIKGGGPTTITNNFQQKMCLVLGQIFSLQESNSPRSIVERNADGSFGGPGQLCQNTCLGEKYLLYTRLLEKELKRYLGSTYSSHMNFPTDTQIKSLSSGFMSAITGKGNNYEQAACSLTTQFTEIGMTQLQLDNLLDKLETDVFPNINVAYLALSKLITTTQPDPYSCNCNSAAISVLNVLSLMKGDNVNDVIEGVSLQDNNIYMEEDNIVDYWNRVNNNSPSEPIIDGYTVTYTPPSSENDSKLTFTKGDIVVNIKSGIEVTEEIFSLSVIRKEVEKLKARVPNYNNLENKEKLIIDLPIIMWKLHRPNAAVTMLHWLEGSGDALKFNFDWVIKNSRALDAYNSALSKLISINSNSGSKINGNDLFDVFGSCTSCNKSYNNSLLYFKNSITNPIPFSYGDFSFDSKTAFKKEFNFIRTEKFGDATGDLDDLGMAWGRTSMRQYVKGNAKKFWNESTNKWNVELNVSDIGIRFTDDFSFNGDCDICIWGINNQPLGTWKYDINNPELPQKIRPEGGGWYILSDNTFSEFSNKTGLGKNYNSCTEFKFLNGNKNPIKKIVLFEFN